MKYNEKYNPPAAVAKLKLRNPETLETVNGAEYLHLIKAVQDARFQIDNNRGRINGWVSANSIFGKCVNAEN